MSEEYLKKALDKIYDYFSNNLTKQAFLSCNTKIIKNDENEWIIIKYSYDYENRGIERKYMLFTSAYSLLLGLVQIVALNTYEYYDILKHLDEEVSILRRKM